MFFRGSIFAGFFRYRRFQREWSSAAVAFKHREYVGTKSYRDERGYLRFRDSGKLLHRYWAEKKLGRKLRPWEVVHHVDGNKCNNHPTNLEVYGSWAEHDAVHRRNEMVYGSWHKPKS